MSGNGLMATPKKPKRARRKRAPKTERLPLFPAPSEPPPDPVPDQAAIDAMTKRVSHEALAWARRSGFQGPIDVEGVEKVDYPRRGYGFKAVVREREGKQRRADTQFTKEGKPSMWTMRGSTFG